MMQVIVPSALPMNRQLIVAAPDGTRDDRRAARPRSGADDADTTAERHTACATASAPRGDGSSGDEPGTADAHPSAKHRPDDGRRHPAKRVARHENASGCAGSTAAATPGSSAIVVDNAAATPDNSAAVVVGLVVLQRPLPVAQPSSSSMQPPPQQPEPDEPARPALAAKLVPIIMATKLTAALDLERKQAGTDLLSRLSGAISPSQEPEEQQMTPRGQAGAYEGGLDEKGRRAGHGKIRYEDGSHFEGGFANGERRFRRHVLCGRREPRGRV